MKAVRNLVPLPYRRVSVQDYAGEMSEGAIRAHLLGRETYRRTDFIVLRQGDATAVVAVGAPDRASLFSPINNVEVLALPDSCRFVVAPETDPSNPSALAAKAHELGVGLEGTLVVLGKYEHVNFIHHPDPLVIRVVEVVPPEPPKLFGLAQHVLSYADLPPIRLELERIDLNDLAAGHNPPAFLVPCRSGGLDKFPAPVYFLDERPAQRQDWTLIGCERSLQFHRHYYGDEPRRIEMCPRVIAGRREELTLVKCCLLEFHVETEGRMAIVPWGADLKMVEEALRCLATNAQQTVNSLS
ncbi:MAG: hypothetical protein RMK99_02885 [Anaerolineales bacterium]|nr:hypothetical protein [Anaerolineales bacterium]